MTREEFESILEEAFLEGYNDAMEEIFEESSNDTVLYSNSKSTVYKKPDGKVNVRLNLSNDEKDKLNGYLKKHTVSLKDLEKAANEDYIEIEDEDYEVVDEDAHPRQKLGRAFAKDQIVNLYGRRRQNNSEWNKARTRVDKFIKKHTDPKNRGMFTFTNMYQPETKGEKAAFRTYSKPMTKKDIEFRKKEGREMDEKAFGGKLQNLKKKLLVNRVMNERR